MRVAVLGSGPAGMFSAHAAAKCSAVDRLDIISNSLEPSVLRGAQYLHEPINGLTDEWCEGWVWYSKRGDSTGYAQRVYGDAHAPTSWDRFDEGRHKTWNLRRAYRKAWHTYKDNIMLASLSVDAIDGLDRNYDLVINTVPLSAFFEPGYDGSHYGARSQKVWIHSWTEHMPRGADIIVYNGRRGDEPSNGWYRFSRLYGWLAEEYATPYPGTVQVHKPLSIDVSPVPESWLCVGRYGAWDKWQLSHDAYFKTAACLDNIVAGAA